MTAIEKIKAKILDLAIRGKLVPQDPNDEPAAELLKRIRAEKEELIKAKKVKKEKNPSEIVIGSDGRPYEKFADGKTVCIEDEIPFDLPPGWTWARIGDVFDLQAGKNIKADYIHEQASPEHPFACFGGNGVRGYVDAVNVQGIHAIIGRQGALCGNLNLSTTKFYATEHAVVVTTFANTETLFAFYFLKAINLNRLATATAQPGLSVTIVNQSLMPVPPFTEQKRIVVKIEELFAEVEKIASATDGITCTVERINKKVLDLAIRGQLVSQDPNDEPAKELLKRIAEARQKVTAGRSRTTAKGESVIFRGADRSAYETRNGKTVCIDDEIPFDIPDSWAWARLGNVSDYGNCVSVDTCQLPSDTWSLDLEEIEKGTGRLIERKTVGEKASTSTKHVFKKGMVLYSKLRTYLNKVLVADLDGVCTSEIIPISLEGDILPEYLRHVLMSPHFLAYTASKDYGVKMPRVGTEDARKALVPIPPLAEQKRIVAKIEEIRTLVELIVRT